MINFILASLLALQTTACIWKDAQTKIEGANISRIHYTSECHRDTINEMETVYFVFVLKHSIWLPNNPLIQKMPPETGHYSVSNGLSSLRYLRLFANYADYVSTGNDIFGNNISAWKYFVSGSVHVWEVAPGVLQMKLSLPTDNSYDIHLLPGMEQCSTHLEDLKLSHYTKCADGVKYCEKLCQSVEMSYRPRPLASFTISIAPTQIKEKVSDATEHLSTTCRFHNKPGTWDRKPVQWKSSIGCSGKLYECDGMVFGGDLQAKSHVHSLCTIGDSHLARAYHTLVSMTKTCHIKFKTLSFFPHSLDIRNAAPVLHSPKQNRSLWDNLRICYNFTSFHSSTQPSAIVWSIGSHVSKFSPAQLAKLVTDSTKSFRRVSVKPPCVLVIGIPASAYETIPAKFGSYFKWLQNPWRTKSQNYAIRKAIDKIPNYHFVDIFDESLAIYYDGHYDAVHLSHPFYIYLADLIIRAAKNKCS